MSQFVRFRGCVWLALLLAAACGGGPRHYTYQMLSDPQADGDITLSPASAAFSITQAVDVGDVIFGFDTSSPVPPESRAFLDFPLDGSTGGDKLPLGASIITADLEVFVESVSFAATVSTQLDLVPFSIPLAASDFNSSPLSATASRNLAFYSTDVGSLIEIDITSLLVEAQAGGLRDFQVRLLLDPYATSGLVQLADGRTATAPLLIVDWE